MYDSRTDKARTPQSASARRKVQNKQDWDAYDALSDRQRGGPNIEEFLDDEQPAMLTEPPININRLHAEALKMHERWFDDRIREADLADTALADWEAELLIGGVAENAKLAYSSEVSDFNEAVWHERMRLEEEDRREREASFDHAYGGYSDDPDDGDHSGTWLPFMRIEELRETFGQNWLGNGFHIVQGNGVRR